MKFLFSFIASLFFLSCFSQNEVETILFLQKSQIDSLKIKSCSGIFFSPDADGKPSCAFADYFLFDTRGITITEDPRSNGGNNVVTYLYDPITHLIKEKDEWTDYPNPDAPLKDSSTRIHMNRDSLIHAGSIHRRTLYHNGKEQRITYFDYGNITSDDITTFYENDTIKEIRFSDNGFVTQVFIYRPNGKLLVDTSFTEDSFEVQEYDERGNPIKRTYFYEGNLSSGDIIVYKYDKQGRQLEITEKSLSGHINEKTVNTFFDNGEIATIIKTDSTGKVVKKFSHEVIVTPADSIIKNYQLYFFSNEQRFNIEENYRHLDRKTRSYYSVKKSYVKDPNGKLIGDTIVETEKATAEKGNIVLWINTKNNKEVFRYEVKYDASGNLIEETRKDGKSLSVQTNSYYENHQMKMEKQEGDGNIYITYYRPDGKIQKKMHTTIDNFTNEVTVYTYDKNGLLISKEDFANGKSVLRIKYVYEFYK